MTVWVFGGQGTQRRGMGRGLFERFPQMCAEADRVLGFSVRELCLDDPDGLLSSTRYAQPALFVVNALSYLARSGERGNVEYFAGHSLGEYNALHAAGCFDFATGLRLVARRGELMGSADSGGMAALVSPDAHRVADQVRREVPEVDLANDNSDDQVVLAGPRASLNRVADIVRGLGVGRCVPLNASAAFHSRYMAGAAAAFSAYLSDVCFLDPTTPVISNVTAAPYPPGGVADLLSRQVNSRVRWRETMGYLVDHGVTELIEVSVRPVLTPLWEAARQHEPRPSAPALNGAGSPKLTAQDLGSAQFRRDYGIRYAYVAGSMFRGVASTDLVVRMAKAGLMGFFGAGGLDLGTVERALCVMRDRTGSSARFGVNLLYSLDDPGAENDAVDLYLRHDVRFVEAAAFPQVTPALVRFRYTGAYRDADGHPIAIRHVLAKVSRLTIAAAFMAPPEERILARLVDEHALTPAEADVARDLPVSADVCVEADSGGHTDGGVALVLMPAVCALREEITAKYRYHTVPRVGASGGLGTPQAVAAAFVLGADFVVTGSVNQCSPEAGMSDEVKEMLAAMDVHDTAYAPAGDMFELGARVQVLKKGSLFAARANKLYQLYRQHESLDSIDPETRRSLEESYFRRSLDEVWAQTVVYYKRSGRLDEIEKAERYPRHKMALVFRWYFAQSTYDAMAGKVSERVNFQVHCGPALGAFNRFARGTDLANVSARHVDAIADRLMHGAAEILCRCAQR